MHLEMYIKDEKHKIPVKLFNVETGSNHCHS